LGVDAASALDLRAHERGSASPLPLSVDGRHHTRGALDAPANAITATATASLCSPLYRLTLWYGVWCTAAWVLYRSATYGDAILVDSFKFIPSVCALVVLICIISPFDFMQRPERDAFTLCVFVRTRTFLLCFYVAPSHLELLGVSKDAYRHPSTTEYISPTWFLPTSSHHTPKYWATSGCHSACYFLGVVS
jgi:hypothetical protein